MAEPTPDPNSLYDKPFPGPWRVGPKNPDPDGLPEIIVEADHPTRRGEVYAVASALPCCAGIENRDVMPRMTLANARLIAAAPDLLAACEALLSLHDGRRHDITMVVEGARKALDEAKGVPSDA